MGGVREGAGGQEERNAALEGEICEPTFLWGLGWVRAGGQAVAHDGQGPQGGREGRREQDARRTQRRVKKAVRRVLCSGLRLAPIAAPWPVPMPCKPSTALTQQRQLCGDAPAHRVRRLVEGHEEGVALRRPHGARGLACHEHKVGIPTDDTDSRGLRAACTHLCLHLVPEPAPHLRPQRVVVQVDGGGHEVGVPLPQLCTAFHCTGCKQIGATLMHVHLLLIPSVILVSVTNARAFPQLRAALAAQGVRRTEMARNTAIIHAGSRDPLHAGIHDFHVLNGAAGFVTAPRDTLARLRTDGKASAAWHAGGCRHCHATAETLTRSLLGGCHDYETHRPSAPASPPYHVCGPRLENMNTRSMSKQKQKSASR